MKFWKAISLLLVTFLAAETAPAVSLDWRAITFKPGHPAEGEGLELYLDNSEGDQADNLATNVDILKEYPAVPYDVVGRASAEECLPEACMALSLRRAQLVYDYLILRGIPRCQIKSVIALGTGSPVSSRSELRAANRSVRLHVAEGDSCQ